jgi:hypothetical protein
MILRLLKMKSYNVKIFEIFSNVNKNLKHTHVFVNLTKYFLLLIFFIYLSLFIVN